MAYGTPTDPVGGTVITVAYAVSNLLDPIRWLRLMTGNAEPPGSSYVAVSDSTTAVTWKRIPTDAIADGAVTSAKLAAGVALANLGYVPLNKGGDSTTAALTVGALTAASAGNPWTLTPFGNDLFIGRSDLGLNVVQLGTTQVRLSASGGAFVNGSQIIDTSNDQTICNAAAVGGRTPTPTPAAGAIPIADGGGKLDAWITPGGVPAAHSHSGDALLPATVNGAAASSTPGAGRIPIADGFGLLDGWVTAASFSIPSGLGFWVRKAADIPTGFTRDTSLDGLIPVGAGTTFSQTFTEETSYGSAWSHTHTDSGHTHGGGAHSHGASALSISGNTGTPSATDGLGNGGGTTTPTATHTHNQGTLDVAGSTDSASLTTNSGSAVISTTTWLPPMRAVVWIRKN